MSLSIGIVGLPNVGKSTLFTALTKKKVEIANYPFATIDPNVGIVEVPDERLEKLAELSRSKEIIPTVVEFVDIAGLVKGAHQGEGLGNKFLTHIREVDAILYLVRSFEDENIQHVEKSVDPVRDIETIRAELALKDLETLERREQKVAGDARTGIKEAQKLLDFLKSLQAGLNDGVHVSEIPAFARAHDDMHIQAFLRELQLLTAKPALYLVNASGDVIPEALRTFFDGHSAHYTIMNALDELEGGELTQEERLELGMPLSRLPDLITAAYRALSLITFLTTGEKETRAWTTKEGSTAPVAAGVIHTDFEEKFIRAEVIHWEKLIEAGGWSKAREKGTLRTEGRDYIVNDGDVLVVLHGA